MRRPAIRLVLAVLATSVLAACADMPMAPKSPAGPRFDGTQPSTTTTDTTLTRTNTQGTEV